MTKDNNLLGTFNLTGIPPAPRGVPKVEVTFDMDANGILNVSAKENSTGKSERITIKNDKGRLSKEDIDKMLKEAEMYRQEDEKQKERVTARNQLEGYAFSVKQAVEEAGTKLSETDKKTVLERYAINDKTLLRVNSHNTSRSHSTSVHAHIYYIHTVTGLTIKAFLYGKHNVKVFFSGIDTKYCKIFLKLSG